MNQELLLNIAADLISAVIITIFGVATFIAAFIFERQKLLKFFGINARNPGLSVFVSRLEIKPGGTTGFEPLAKGYFGPGIIRVEYRGALIIRDVFRSSLLGRLPRGLQGWLRQQAIVLADIDPSIDVSPQNIDELQNGNLVLLGTGIYNLGSKIYLDHPSSCFRYGKNDKGDRVFVLNTPGMEGVEMPGRSINRELGVVQRINDRKNNRVIFICAGLGASATYGCARYLMENWKKLHRTYKDGEFGICLAFEGQPFNSEDVARPKPVYEYPPAP